MDRIIVDKNSRAVQIVSVGFGQTFGVGEVSSEVKGIVRFKALEDSSFRYSNQPSSVIEMNAGDTEYFFVEPENTLSIVSGRINLMW